MPSSDSPRLLPEDEIELLEILKEFPKFILRTR